MMAALSGKLTRKRVDTLGAGRHGDGNGLYLVVDPSGARRWIVRVTVKGQKNRLGDRLWVGRRGYCDVAPGARSSVGVSAHGQARPEPPF
ncbi:Arm DNA-binding domain-containing protein [Aquimixticola soesokkakensis]|uniref:Arm DNA-binding domain-containing protein n=1 Tax=Aquimixticola soesokkakensis TaxID=1519096 RepID=UPI0035205116